MVSVSRISIAYRIQRFNTVVFMMSRASFNQLLLPYFEHDMCIVRCVSATHHALIIIKHLSFAFDTSPFHMNLLRVCM